jgi:hypothetical protein
MDTVPELNKATAIAATGQTKAAATVQVKLAPQGYFIDHPDPQLGELEFKQDGSDPPPAPGRRKTRLGFRHSKLCQSKRLQQHRQHFSRLTSMILMNLTRRLGVSLPDRRYQRFVISI